MPKNFDPLVVYEILNRHLVRKQGGGKVSFTHLIGWSVVQAVKRMPGMNVTYGTTSDGKPEAVRHSRLNLGLAVDVKRSDGTRTLLVPTIEDAHAMDFAGFFAAYEELIRKVSTGKLAPDDFAGTTVSITNPGIRSVKHPDPMAALTSSRSAY